MLSVSMEGSYNHQLPMEHLPLIRIIPKQEAFSLWISAAMFDDARNKSVAQEPMSSLPTWKSPPFGGELEAENLDDWGIVCSSQPYK